MFDYDNFKKWLGDNDVEVSQNQYLYGLSNIQEDFKVDINVQFDKDKCEELLKRIKLERIKLERIKNKGGIKKYANYVSYLNKYIEFKESFSGQLANAQSTIDEEKAESNYGSKASIQNKYSKILLNSRNIIFHGAPGTGKTYLAKQIAAEIVSNGKTSSYEELEDNLKKCIGFVQFHPSYDYSDFVEGLRPIVDDSGNNMTFQVKDGVFKKFVDDAVAHTYKENEALDSKLDSIIEDYITQKIKGQNNANPLRTPQRGTEFYIKGRNIINGRSFIQTNVPSHSQSGDSSVSIDILRKLLKKNEHFDNSPKKISDYVNNELGKEYHQGNASYLLPIYNDIRDSEMYKAWIAQHQDYVFIIDEINRGEISKIFGELFYSIDPGYRGEKGAISTQYSYLHNDPTEKFYIPENVYIIGTMNDIDRSVDSFDFAMRRRFRFINITAEERADDMFKSLDEENRDAVKNRMTNLNIAIAKTPDLNENYQIGPAYFLKLEELGYDKNGFDSLWMDYLEPLLQDYVMGMSDADVLMNNFKDAYDNPEKEKSTNGTNQTAGADGEADSEETVTEFAAADEQ